jgi:ABC-2 type transport system ATP-binding protein
MSGVISTRQLGVTFRGRGRRADVVALRPLDLDVSHGQVTGILGPNGSGKTTLLRVLAGLQKPGEGTATVCGLTPSDKRLTQRVAYQPEAQLPLSMLSGREFLQWHGMQLGMQDAVVDEAKERWLARLALQHAADRRLQTYSTGMQKRLALAAALLSDPEVLLLDEPTSGLDPVGSGIVMEVLQEQAANGAAVLLASHHLQEVEQTCSDVLLLHRGACHFRGPMQSLPGTTGDSLVVEGLSETARAEVSRLVAQHGGRISPRDPSSAQLFALFRKLSEQDPATGDDR